MRKIEGFKHIFEKCKKKGVKIRIAAPVSKEGRKLFKELGKAAEVRHTDSKARFMVVDGKEIVFMAMDDQKVHPTYDIGIWVTTPFFSQAVENLFDSAWKGMKPIK